ncbi:MAG TPA: nucleotide sugar dehydrogenase [Clostridiales bacterium]|nr:nucleotide sugar dehydrogenase [Clostridiales bacterium]
MKDCAGAKDGLLQKIHDKTAVAGVLGLGYVGLPLAVQKAKTGFKTIGFDIQKHKVDMVNQGRNYINDIPDDDLSHVVSTGMLNATDDIAFIGLTDCIAICVPTPLDIHRQPDLSYVINSAKAIAEYLHRGMLVVLESTTYPGTTEEVIKPLLESSGLKCGEDFFLAFSPERVDPGNKLYKTKNTPKVVGGVTKDCTEVASAFYRNILEDGIVEVSSPAVAEMEKILENTYRNINIALANEMAILCNKMGINVWEVIEAAKSKPYGFVAFYPGPGIGGHCIPIDPFYLTWKAREFDYHTRLIEVAGEINSGMPEFICTRVMFLLNKRKIALNGAHIFIIGVAYKQDIDDLRESPVLKVMEKLEEQGALLTIHDPFIPVFQHNGKEYRSEELSAEKLKNADIVVITTAHSCLDYNFIQRNSTTIFDTKNAMKNAKDRDNVVLL